jgi:hypothetical protein
VERKFYNDINSNNAAFDGADLRLQSQHEKFFRSIRKRLSAGAKPAVESTVMTGRNLRWLLWLCLATPILLLSGCGGGGGGGSEESLAATSDVLVAGTESSASVFMSLLHLRGTSLRDVAALHYTIAPKTGVASKPIRVNYTIAALERHGYAVAGAQEWTIPIIGLYAAFANSVTVMLDFDDGSSQTLVVTIGTPPYVDPNSIYDHLTIRTARSAGSALGFDFLLMKSELGFPVVLDSDGEIRWIGAVGQAHGGAIAFQDNGFVIGDSVSPTVFRFELDGSITEMPISSPTTITNFSHNLDPGKTGLLAEVDTRADGVENIESTAAEIASAGAVLDQWDIAALLWTYMSDHGDDPSGFIRPGMDWFHMNSATYDLRDDSLIISSRENFVIKVGYHTRDVIWIFGDPTKYWYSFPSLRAKALVLEPGGLYPIGQHALSITPDGLLLLFNDGAPSFNQPTGAPAGVSRAYSAVSAYAIDPSGLTAREAWRFDYGQTILSSICSSAYEGSGNSILIDYADADAGTKARLVGLDSDSRVVFDFEYPTHGCNTSWNTQPIAFENLDFE